MTRESRVVVDAVARTVNEAARSLRAIREWCDATEAAMEKSIKNAPRSAAQDLFTYNAALMAAVHEVRALLPQVPPADEEDPACPTATLPDS